MHMAEQFSTLRMLHMPVPRLLLVYQPYVPVLLGEVWYVVYIEGAPVISSFTV